MAITCSFVGCRCILGVTFDKAQFAGMEKVIEEIYDIWYILQTKRLLSRRHRLNEGSIAVSSLRIIVGSPVRHLC